MAATPPPRFKGKSFGWAFWLAVLLVACATWWAPYIGLPAWLRATFLAVAGFVPLLIQLGTGYALNGGWVASFSRRENPKHYWGSLFGAVALALVFGYGAYHLLEAS